MKLWIFDTDSTPQRFPLLRLMDQIEQVVGHPTKNYFVRKSRGYGLRVNEWDSLLDEQDSISVQPSELRRIGSGVDEWFYDMEALSVESDIVFGIHDSTAMFVDGPESVVRQIVKPFERVKEHTSQ